MTEPEGGSDRPADRAYAAAVGRQLRVVRERLGWSLARAADESHGRFASTTLLAWEHATRALKIDVLHALADLYRVPVTTLLPATLEQTTTARADLGPIVLDLHALPALPVHLARPLTRYATIVQGIRDTIATDRLRVRTADLVVIAALLETTPTDLIDQLSRWHALVPPPRQQPPTRTE
jgi:transcriptional regulator with XRE-family HTH domain